MIKAVPLFAALLATPVVAIADANNPWPAVNRFIDMNGCRITEAQLVDVLKAEGVDTWTINLMVTNYAKKDEVTFDSANGQYRVKTGGVCN